MTRTFFEAASLVAGALTLAACSGGDGAPPGNGPGADGGVDATGGNDSGSPIADSGADATDSGGGKDSGNGVISCAGFDGTLVMDIPWTAPFSVGYTSNVSPYTCNCNGAGFTAKAALVVRFTTPAVAPGLGWVSLSEFQGSPTARSGSLSATPCDFTGGIGGQGVFAGDVGIGPIYFTVGTKTSGTIELQPSTTYYVNVENYYMGNLMCTNPTCDMKMTLTTPK